MAHNTPQKIKLMKIWEILQKKTDPDHQMTTRELLAELAQLGISCERRSLYRDIETLNLNGYEVLTGRNWQENTYYVRQRQFDVPEIRILMDAVQSAAFIPEGKAEQLLDKLAGLSGGSRAQLLKNHAVQFRTVRHSNEDIYRNVALLEKALEDRRAVTFRYFHLNADGTREYAHEGQSYCEEPIGMIFEDGNYYLLCYRSQPEYVNGVKVFRIDRIEGIAVGESTISKAAAAVHRKVSTYRLQAFRMYGGEVKNVTLEFVPDLIEVVFDKFGHDTRIRRCGELCRASVKVQISPTFWGWMLQFPTRMKIYSPEELKEEYADWVRSALDRGIP